MLTPALYRTRIGHMRTKPVRHSFQHRSYSWYVDVDDLPSLPWWLRPFAGFTARDHFFGREQPAQSLRAQVEACLLAQGRTPPGGRVTALLQARVLGHVFNPLSLFWCHEQSGELRYVVAEVHNTYGGRHAYVLELDANGRAEVDKEFYVSPFNPVDGLYRIRAPEPAAALDVAITLVREGSAMFVATMRGTRRLATAREVARLQLVAPLAPLVGAFRIRMEGVLLWLRRVPVVPR